jgi:hypothetical protein
LLACKFFQSICLLQETLVSVLDGDVAEVVDVRKPPGEESICLGHSRPILPTAEFTAPSCVSQAGFGSISSSLPQGAAISQITVSARRSPLCIAAPSDFADQASRFGLWTAKRTSRLPRGKLCRRGARLCGSTTEQ